MPSIDKLCLPYENMARQLALLNAPRIMKKVDKVLVLDPTLYLVNIADLTERLARIQYSTWISRFWIAREGASANNLIFLFQSRHIELRSLVEDWDGRDNRIVQDGKVAETLAAALARFDTDMQRFRILKHRKVPVQHYDEYELNFFLQLGYLQFSQFDWLKNEVEAAYSSILVQLALEAYAED
ncbi:hypothetical protein OEA41_006009 [Lepraria neglecta]|uniref:Uncharacterized protein n=1 Tax=Lepraria neglecta TaxID=209136 RepID=A0AAD9Z6X3_9LECA|nr:hypothetical protein OEA41_006009 [Lepraria neglecta]